MKEPVAYEDAVDLLDAGVPLETVSILLGHKSFKATEKHYAPPCGSHTGLQE